MVVESCVVYKAIYNYSFLDKEFLYSWCVYTNNKGAICSSGVSLASLWRPLYSPIIFIVCLAYIFLLKPLDPSNLESWYKAFRLFYYLLYSYCIIHLVSLFYPKADRD